MIVRTLGELNRLQPRVTREWATARIENPGNPPRDPYEVGVVVVDANGQAWQRDIDNLVDEHWQLGRGEQYWWKVGSGDDSLTSKSIPLPARVWFPDA